MEAPVMELVFLRGLSRALCKALYAAAINSGNYIHLENLENIKPTEKTFDSVKYMRLQPDKLSEQFSIMSKEEMIAYFKNRMTKTTIKPCAEKRLGVMAGAVLPMTVL